VNLKAVVVNEEGRGQGAGGRTLYINAGAWNKDVLFLALVRLEINVSILRINKFRGLNAQKLHPQRDGVFHFEADVALPDY
jgi:hypothetical protein